MRIGVSNAIKASRLDAVAFACGEKWDQLRVEIPWELFPHSDASHDFDTRAWQLWGVLSRSAFLHHSLTRRRRLFTLSFVPPLTIVIHRKHVAVKICAMNKIRSKFETITTFAGFISLFYIFIVLCTFIWISRTVIWRNKVFESSEESSVTVPVPSIHFRY